MKLTTTFCRLREAGACEPRYEFLRAALEGVKDDESIDLLTVLETNGLDDALWALQATEQNCDQIARLMAADFAEQVLPIWQKYSQDSRPEMAIKAARDFAHGRITREKMAAARDAARAAARAAVDAWSAASDARNAAVDAAWAAAGDAALDAARAAVASRAAVAAWSAARSAVDAAGDAVDAAVDAARAARNAVDAWSAARAAARAAAVAAVRAKQREIFIGYLVRREGVEKHETDDHILQATRSRCL